jgi:hypothetical protein
MISCPHCGKNMRNVHEYGDDFNDYIVWHCWDCDFTVVLDAHTEKIAWIPVRETEKKDAT